MTAEDVLWSREQGFWAATRPRIDDRRITREGPLAVLTYRVTTPARPLRCRSTYARSCGSWLLVEHRQSAA
jgi:hypothetical protein